MRFRTGGVMPTWTPASSITDGRKEGRRRAEEGGIRGRKWRGRNKRKEVEF